MDTLNTKRSLRLLRSPRSLRWLLRSSRMRKSEIHLSNLSDLEVFTGVLSKYSITFWAMACFLINVVLFCVVYIHANMFFCWCMNTGTYKNQGISYSSTLKRTTHLIIQIHHERTSLLQKTKTEDKNYRLATQNVITPWISIRLICKSNVLSFD